MALPMKTHFENLRAALLELKATGESGFEGAMAVALYSITGIPFRLANSGYQRGIDGKAAFEGSIAFEGKLYTNSLPRTDVLSKIPDLVRHSNHADLVWVLGATCEVPSQLAEDLRADGTKQGVSVLVLDWVPSDFPRLAVALAMGEAKVEEFLTNNLKSQDARNKALAALLAIRDDTDFARHMKTIHRDLDAPGMATAMAEKANAKWFEETVSSKARARSELGQPLAPADTAIVVIGRDGLISTLGPYFTNTAGEDVICVHGEEGCGKSWIVMQSWIAQSSKPLLVFATPDDFSEAPAESDIEDLLISKLIRQTGDIRSEENTVRWRRRLAAWKDVEKPQRPRLIVVIDGINQRPGRAWGKITDNVATYVVGRGGRVIITARTQYFNTRVKRALTSSIKDITVPKWSAAERNQILKQHDVPVNKLSSSVAEFLLNPRILSIALEAFGDDVTAFEELSVDRLLFEHIMMGVKHDFGEHPVDFVAVLRKHAKKLLDRVTSQANDDLYIFESDVPAVVDGRFFHPVTGEPLKYELRDEGLTLALGLSIIENLRAAKRSSRDLNDALKQVLEPVEALDRTAEAVIAAISVTAADDDEYCPAIAQALIREFIELQNPPPGGLAVLISFAKARPLVFAETARDLSLEGGHQSNFDLIESALVIAARNEGVWNLLKCEVPRWLRVYSLSPERRMHTHAHRDPPEKVAEERANRQAVIDDNLAKLSPAEAKRMERLIETNGEIDALSRLALILLAGKSLKPFAESLTDWSFANALNSSIQVPTKEFLALIGLNRQDWSNARRALLQACEDLRTDTASKVGRWALLRILRATGDPDDDRSAEALYVDLIKDLPSYPGWGHTDDITEPCDPSSNAPTKLDETVQRYQDINVTKLRQYMGQTAEDHALVNDRPIVVRFALETAVTKHRELAGDVVKRIGIPLRQGLLELREHASIVTSEQAHALAARWKEAQVEGDTQGLKNDDHIMLQYELVIAFPFLEVDEQLEIMLATTEGNPLLLELVDSTKTPDAQTLDRVLEKGRSTHSEHQQHLFLEIAAATGAELSSEVCAFARQQINSKVNRLRTSALALAARSGHSDLLKAVVESDWESSAFEATDRFESWYGSLALLEAAEAGLVDGNTIIDRISPSLYGRAATMLKETEVQEIARRIDVSIRCAVGMPDELVAPLIELEAESKASREPIRFSISDRSAPSKDIKSFFDEFSESDEEFRQRQNRNYDSFRAFQSELTSTKAQIILDHLTLEEFAVIVHANPTVADQWFDLFMDVSESKLPAVHNLILLLASALADTKPDRSVALFERVKHNHPLVRFTFSGSGVDLESESVWKASNSPPMNKLRKQRLDNAATDQAIAVEVYSALRNNQKAFLDDYVDAKLLCREPAEKARALMVVGYSNPSDHNEGILEKFQGNAGLPGKAYKAASISYWNNLWAQHWFKKMCETNDPTTYWQAAVLFVHCVDGRFQTWRDEFDQVGIPIGDFGASVTLRQRLKKLGKERQKKFFGQDAPPEIFLR